MAVSQMEHPDDSQVANVTIAPSKFKRGSIVRIQLENFMIYENVVFEPGPFLNLILGPNGSGKSAIVCSIIMGFGGDPQITGRSSNLIDYIRFGSHLASIKIELFSGNVKEKNMIIERQMRIVSKNAKNECVNTWKLNGKSANKTTISEFTNSLNIDINNLCQVLPQERVVEFSRLPPKELLLSTEKSIGDINMYERHMRLIVLSNEVTDIQQKIKNCNAFILKYQSFKSNIEPDLKLVQQKKKFEYEIEWLVKKKSWVEYEDKRTEYVDKKNEFLQKKQELVQANKNLSPSKLRLDSCDDFLKKLKGQKSKSSVIIRQSYAKISELNRKLEGIQEEVNKSISNYNEDLSKQRISKNRLVSFEQDLVNYQNELLNYTDKDHFEAQLETFRSELTEIDNEMRKNLSEVGSKRSAFERLQAEKRSLIAKIQSLKNTFNLKLDKISITDTHTKLACGWLDKNRDKFKGEICYPIITQINVIKQEYVAFVEAAIGTQDLSTFLFEDKTDLQTFCDLLDKECKIRVNVAMLPRDFGIEDCVCTFDRKFQSYGIIKSVRDLFTAPDKVMAYLCKTYNIHRVPVGDDKTDQCIQELMSSSPFRKIITSKNMYSIIVSQYDNAKSNRMARLGEPKYLNIIVDQDEVDEVDRKLNLIEDSINEAQKALDRANEKNDELKELFENKQEQYNQYKSKKNAIAMIESKIKEKERQIKVVKDSLASMDKSKQNVSRKLATHHSEQLMLLEELSTKINICVDHTSSESVSSSKIYLLNNLRSLFEKSYNALAGEVNSLEKKVKQMDNELRKSRDAAKEARDHARQISGFDFNTSQVPQEVSDKFIQLPGTLEDLENAISILKLRCEGIANIDESVLVEYQKYIGQITEKTTECSDLEKELAAKEKEIQTLKPLWLNALNSLIDQINFNFSKFMEHLHYSGEVYLFGGNKEYAFDDYGIRIKVKFRDSEPMKDLDAYHQSGGERSVSTMIYMLSLQELANVPFRVVDEINQGMDEKNERCVFDLISEVSRRNSSQYFLLSPKLLTKLNYTPEMKVHIIFNGPKVFIDWNKIMPELLKKKEESMISA